MILIPVGYSNINTRRFTIVTAKEIKNIDYVRDYKRMYMILENDIQRQVDIMVEFLHSHEKKSIRYTYEYDIEHTMVLINRQCDDLQKALAKAIAQDLQLDYTICNLNEVDGIVGNYLSSMKNKVMRSIRMPV